tara:strand:+ start:148 stop:357 length:210 start_codon:yes stop_codon:yes gene_type:complete
MRHERLRSYVREASVSAASVSAASVSVVSASTVPQTGCGRPAERGVERGDDGAGTAWNGSDVHLADGRS